MIGGQSCLRSGAIVSGSASSSLDAPVAGDLGEGVAERRLAAAGGDLGHLLDRGLAGVEQRPGLQGGQAHRVRPQRPDRVRVELAGHHHRQVAGRRLAVAVDEGGVDLAELELHPGLVERPGAVHLDVALLDRRPGPDAVEGHHEAEGGTGQVVGAARAGEADVADRHVDRAERLGGDRHEHLDLVAVVDAALVLALGEGDDGDVAHQAAPSVRELASASSGQEPRPVPTSSPGMRTSPSGSPVGRNHLMFSRVGPHSASSSPHGLDPHADVDVGRVDLLEEVHDRQVGAVELDQAARVGHLHPLAVELHVHDAEAGDRPRVGELDRFGRRHAEVGVGAAGGHVDLPARRLLADDLPLGEASQEAGLRLAGGERVAQRGRGADALHGLDALRASAGSVIVGHQRRSPRARSTRGR